MADGIGHFNRRELLKGLGAAAAFGSLGLWSRTGMGQAHAAADMVGPARPPSGGRLDTQWSDDTEQHLRPLQTAPRARGSV